MCVCVRARVADCVRGQLTEMVTSDFFPVQNHSTVNAVFITSRYGKNAMEPSGVAPDPDGGGFWNYLMAYTLARSLDCSSACLPHTPWLRTDSSWSDPSQYLHHRPALKPAFGCLPALIFDIMNPNSKSREGTWLRLILCYASLSTCGIYINCARNAKQD